MRRFVVLLAAFTLGAAIPVAAQGGARVEVTVDTASKAPSVRVVGLLAEERWRTALDDAFPVRLKWRIEIWRDRALIDQAVDGFEFDIVIRRDPLLGYFYFTIFQRDRPPQDFPPYTDLASFVGQVGQRIDLRSFAPRTPGSYYYAVTLRVSALDDDEFVEMRRFMGSGGGGSVLDAIRGGIMKLVGVPSQTFTVRSQQIQIR